jgi:hypothetical protein
MFFPYLGTLFNDCTKGCYNLSFNFTKSNKIKGGEGLGRFAKGFKFIGLVFILGSIVGCNNSADDNNMNGYSTIMETNDIENEEMIMGKYPFPNETEATGSGEITINTPAGTSEEGKTPVFFVDGDDRRVQIGIDAEGFDGSRQSFVYVDKIYLRPEQFVGRKDTSIGLQGAMLKPGIHTISFIQFEGDDPINGKVTSYTEARYAVERKNRDD